jgi:spoIIIJ-associated protein
MLIDEETTRPNDPEDDADGGEFVVADLAEVETLARQVLEGLGLDVTVKVKDAEETIEVDVDGADRDLLIDHGAEALEALQYLANRIIYRGRSGKKIHFDSAGFRRGREDDIVEAARKTAESVKAKGKEMLLNPLNPYERRLVHIALAEIDGVGTRSVGDGFLKRIAIFLKSDAPRRQDR